MTPRVKERPDGDLEKMHQYRPASDANQHPRRQPEVTFDRCRLPFHTGQGGDQANRVNGHTKRHQAPSDDEFRKHGAEARGSSVAELERNIITLTAILFAIRTKVLRDAKDHRSLSKPV